MYFQDFLNKYSRTLIMGILNITPDSFYDGNQYLKDKKLASRFSNLHKCDIIDIGAESSRPGSKPVNESDELKRLSKVFSFLKDQNKYYSIDTYKPNIARECIKNGFNMINDITGAKRIEMFQVAIEFQVPIVLMHMQGNPANMQKKPKYNDLIDELMSFFEKRIKKGIKEGIDERQIVIDPGIGFGKTVSQNDKIIRNLHKFKRFGVPVLVGLSRKSFLTYNSNQPKDRLESSLAVSAIAINNGADIIRVHDIDKSLEVCSILDRLLKK